MPTSSTNTLLALLRFAAGQPEKSLEPGRITDQMKRLGLLAADYRLNPHLALICESLNMPAEAIPYLPAKSAERILNEHLLSLNPALAAQFREELRVAVGSRSKPDISGPGLQKKPGARATPLFKRFLAQDVQMKWLDDCRHHQPPTERIVWPVKQALWEEAGMPKLLAPQFILHVGLRSLRAALFCPVLPTEEARNLADHLRTARLKDLKVSPPSATTFSVSKNLTLDWQPNRKPTEAEYDLIISETTGTWEQIRKALERASKPT